MLLCRRPYLVTSLRMCPRRRLISRSPRYLLTWQCRRFSTVSVPHPWMLQCRRSHTVLFLRTFPRRWVLAQLPCSVDMFVQTPVRSTVLHDAATHLPLTEFFIGCIYSNDPLDRQNFVRQSPPSVQGPRALLQPPPGFEQPAPPPELAAYSHIAYYTWCVYYQFSQSCLQSPVSTNPCGEHTLYAQLPAPKEVLVPPLREPTILLV